MRDFIEKSLELMIGLEKIASIVWIEYWERVIAVTLVFMPL